MKAVNITSSLSKREKIRRKPFEAPEQSFDFVSPPIEDLIGAPGVNPATQRRDDGRETEVESQLPRLVAFVRPIHDQGDRLFRHR
jgi:hypothetical protein